MINITLTGDQADEVVVQELKLSLELLLKLDNDEDGNYLEPDLELIAAIKTTLAYFMPHHEMEEYLKGVALKELAMQVQS